MRNLMRLLEVLFVLLGMFAIAFFLLEVSGYSSEADKTKLIGCAKKTFCYHKYVPLRIPTVVSRQEVWDYLCSCKKIKFPVIVFKQIIAETGCEGHWVRDNNNLTCMRLPKQRRTTAIGEKNGYAVYLSWQSCIDDYAIFQSMFTGKTEDEYYDFLKRYDNVDSAYVDSIRTKKVYIPH